MDEMCKIFHQTTYRFLRIGEVHKLMMDDMYENGGRIAKFGYETRVSVVVLVARIVFVCLVGWLVCTIHKIGLYTLSLWYEREYPPFCLLYMTFLMPSVIKLSCTRSIGWKQ